MFQQNKKLLDTDTNLNFKFLNPNVVNVLINTNGSIGKLY